MEQMQMQNAPLSISIKHAGLQYEISNHLFNKD